MVDLPHTLEPDEPVDVLLVEDNPGDARLTREAFESTDLEMALHVVTDAMDAVAFLRREGEYAAVPPPTLVLLDLDLPGGDGCEVLGAIREDERLQRLPVLVLTSSGDEEDVTRCYEAHANAYLTKPRAIDEYLTLAERVEEFWFGQAHLPPVPS